ncbi:hypothetical protein P9112_005943 [Eukaryota sp. TZLM1-RC]
MVVALVLTSLFIGLLSYVIVVLILRRSFYKRFDAPKVTFIGLDNSGKSVLLYMLKDNEIYDMPSTIGFNVENVTLGYNKVVTVYDVGGQRPIRPLWRHYFHSTKLICFVIDGSKPDRFKEALDELIMVDESSDLSKNCKMMVVVNKKDCEGFVPCDQIRGILGLDSFKRKWATMNLCAIDTDSVDQLRQWLYNHI